MITAIHSMSYSRPLSPATPTRPIFGYDVIDFIGEGAGSVIYAVSHPESKQLYALKHVIRRTDRDARFVEQLENEFEVGQRVGHPGLRRCIELRTNGGFLRRTTEAALVMELFDGLPLEMRAPLGVYRTVSVFIQAARALEAMHRAGYVHCDLKPNNILIAPDDRVKLIDFGQTCPHGTAKKRIQGTPDFMAPEQVRCEPVSFRTDIFNLGATLYWSLCGRKLPTLFNLKKGQNSFLLDERIPSPREINAEVPESLSNLVMECVRTSPSRRPVDMAELGRRLEIVEHVMHRNSHRGSELVA